MSGSEFDFSDDGGDLGSIEKTKSSSNPSKRKAVEESTPSSKRRKSRQKKKSSDSRDEDIDENASIDLRIGRMNTQLLADHWARQIQRFEPDIDVISLEDRRLPAGAFIETSDWAQTRDLERLPQFLEKYSGLSKRDLAAAPPEKGCPHTLVIAAAGIRAADLTRALRVFQSKNVALAKLFAKHIKLAEASEFVKSRRINFGIGTPQRIEDIISAGSMSLKHLKCIIVDASWVNVKKRGILDLPETQVPLSRLLARAEFKDRYEMPDGDSTKRIAILVY